MELALRASMTFVASARLRLALGSSFVAETSSVRSRQRRGVPDVDELTLEQANARLADDGYPPIQRLPADPAALASWRRIVDAKRELEETGKLSDATFLAVSSFCHCYKCPSYPRGERAVYCLGGKSGHQPILPSNCFCPSCEVYKMGQMQGTNYYCMTGAPGKKLAAVGGALGVAAKLLDMEIGKGNPGKRVPERLMAPPSLIGATQDEVHTPEKVPGSG